jgi:hypothetical protein
MYILEGLKKTELKNYSMNSPSFEETIVEEDNRKVIEVFPFQSTGILSLSENSRRYFRFNGKSNCN